MPPVGDLDRLRQRLGRGQSVATASIPSDDLDLRLVGKPGLRRRRLAIRQQCNRLAPLKVADDRPIALVAPPGPVVNPDHRRRDEARTAVPSYDAQQRVVAHRQHQPAGETRRGPATQGKPEMVDDMVEPSGPTRPRRQHVLIKALNKNAPPAEDGVTMKSPRHDDEPNRPTRQGEIR